MEDINKILLYFGFSSEAGKENLYKSPLTGEKTPSFHTNYSYQGKIVAWKDFSSGKGGNDIQFILDYSEINPPQIIDKVMTKRDGTTYTYSAVAQAINKKKEILGIDTDTYTAPTNQHTAPKVELNKPKGNTLVKSGKVWQYALKNYLLSRGINEHLFPFIDEVTYLNHKTGREFYGVGIENQHGGWAYRSKAKNGKGNVGKTGITIIDNGSKNIKVVEGMFDFWSLLQVAKITPNDKRTNFVILNSTTNTSALFKHIKEYGKYKKIEAYLDNGSTGDLATIEIHEFCENNNFSFKDNRIKYGAFDDLNDMLLGKISSIKEPRVYKEGGCYNIIYKGKFISAFNGTFKDLEARFKRYCINIKKK